MVRYVILIFLLASCTAKKNTSEKIEVRDSLTYSEKRILSYPIETHIVISEICDKHGKLRHYKEFETSGNNKAKVRFSEDNKIHIYLLTGQSEKVEESTKESKKSNIDTESEEVKIDTRSTFWHWTVHILSFLLILLLIKVAFRI